MAEPHPLSDRDVAVLEFERRWGEHTGAKDEAIRAQFGFSAARYYQVLNALIDTAPALAHDPMLVRRLIRQREARAGARMARADLAHHVGRAVAAGRPRDH